MQNQYLCPIHRKWALMHPLEALFQIEKAKKEGEYLRQKQQWDQALPLLGCALEMTEIVMQANKSRGARYSLLYTALAVAVADTLFRLQEMEQASYTLSNSAAWLNEVGAEVSHQSKSSICLMECTNTLRKGAQFFAHILHQSHPSFFSANLH